MATDTYNHSDRYFKPASTFHSTPPLKGTGVDGARIQSDNKVSLSPESITIDPAEYSRKYEAYINDMYTWEENPPENIYICTEGTGRSSRRANESNRIGERSFTIEGGELSFNTRTPMSTFLNLANMIANSKNVFLLTATAEVAGYWARFLGGRTNLYYSETDIRHQTKQFPLVRNKWLYDSLTPHEKVSSLNHIDIASLFRNLAMAASDKDFTPTVKEDGNTLMIFPSYRNDVTSHELPILTQDGLIIVTFDDLKDKEMLQKSPANMKRLVSDYEQSLLNRGSQGYDSSIHSVKYMDSSKISFRQIKNSDLESGQFDIRQQPANIVRDINSAISAFLRVERL